MKNIIIKNFLTAITLTAAIGLAGCGTTGLGTLPATGEGDTQGNAAEEVKADSTEPESEQAETAGAAEPADITHVVISTGGTGPKPYIWTDENNELQGYDIEVTKEIFSRLPQYDYEFVTTSEWLTGLDAGLYDFTVQHAGFNKERAEKYIFSDAYNADPHGILVRDDNNEIRGLEDLPGHVTEVSAGSNNANIFEEYNAAHPDAPIELKYIDEAAVNMSPQQVSLGNIDFYFFTQATLESQVEELGLDNVKIISIDPAEKDEWAGTVTGNFFIAPKNRQALLDDINTAFEEALADGTIERIAKETTGDSVSVPTIEYIEDVRSKIAEIQANLE
ncbi:MAG: transporter substrate-binding domain-containing protein [Lachnospiraceae bacterium]|nr:transporter substrate-binding domain-containing protein [Lachnospiraceae bacterium]